MYFPNELWRIIKDFMIDYKFHHNLKYNKIIKHFDNNYGEILERWTTFPPLKSTDEMQHEFNYIKPGLILTSICWNIRDTGKWWCGYGWSKGNSYQRIQYAWRTGYIQLN
jgi:hypothetical protein